MVMESCWIYYNTSLRGAATLRLISSIVLFLLLFCVTCGESRTNHCRVNNCAQSYNRVNSRLEVAEKRKPDVDFSKRRCRILNNLHRCLHRTGRGCRGDLLFHSLQRVTDTNLERANCTFEKTLPLVSLRTIRNATIEHPDLSSSVVQESSECFFKTEPNFRHCGMFGDPHIRTFSDRFYTCNVEKAWHLIDNEYMVVMATNVPVKEGSEATVTTKITVLIKSVGKCAEQRHYVATSRRLPGAFTDGSSITGSVAVTEIEPGNHVEINIRFIATTVIIRRVAGFLTFAIQMPLTILNGTLEKQQLCVGGCPLSHRIAPVMQLKARSTRHVHEPTSSGPGEAKLVRSHTKRAFHDTKQLNSVKTFTQISEEEARKLCKRIILEITEDMANVNDQVMPESRQNSTNSNKTRKTNSSTSIRKTKKRGKRKKKPKILKTANQNHIRSSFQQLLPVDGINGDPTSPDILRQEKQKLYRKQRNKRDLPDASSQDKKSNCLLKDENDEFSDFNFYFDSCVFDLQMTNDVNFTLSAKAALLDLTRTHILGFDAPGASLEVVRNWEPNCPVTPNGVASKSINFTLPFLCVFFACLYVNLWSIFTISSNDTVEKTLFRRKFSGPERRTKTFSYALLGS